jgi:cytidylate kinase
LRKKIIIAIDGPAGSGKSTIARLIAEELNFLYIDTGAMYRALTLKAIKSNVSFQKKDDLINQARETEVNLKPSKNGLRVYLDSQDVTDDIREPDVTRNVVYLADIPEIREIMVRLQRRLGQNGGVVIEGRDVTSVVFPDADKKFYLDADFSERVQRRFKQLQERGKVVSRDELSEDIEKRDKFDKTRKIGALKQTEDSIYINTTGLSIKEVIKKVLSYV